MAASDVLSLRADLAAALTAVSSDAFTVYDHPAESVALPAVILVPGNPYWEVGTFGPQPGAAAAGPVRVNIDIKILVPRTEIETAVAAIESFGVAVGLALAAFPGLRWVSMSSLDAIDVGDMPALGVTIEATGKY